MGKMYDKIKKMGKVTIDETKFGINFKFHIINEEKYRYNMLAIYEPNIVDNIRANDYDNDKCWDIIQECSHNLLVVKAGNADASKPEIKAEVQKCLRAVALAVLRMAILDPYRSVAINPDSVLSTTLCKVNGRIGYDLTPDGEHSLLYIRKGIKSYVENDIKKEELDFYVELA